MSGLTWLIILGLLPVFGPVLFGLGWLISEAVAERRRARAIGRILAQCGSNGQPSRTGTEPGNQQPATESRKLIRLHPITSPTIQLRTHERE